MHCREQLVFIMLINPVDNFWTEEGENPTPYGILALWAVNGLSIVYWEGPLINVPYPLAM